ncbi:MULTISPECIES: hypothetical protein [Ensifer]|jgi:hypothetical protein|uniref:DUF680 domain-containing protein n=1 Tax=Ensifer canadensis TaxID=555315 RepID=A0AAW4FC54_9HYPH|nr:MULTISPECIES: hypothetical protein [Ensifer]MDP9629579.1 hypothetical protein [Ensifer adhaerens]KQU72034.1 hypothetical protein ASD00_14375 [Ensifer sp. Root31]KQW44221.1 hypothetical protein ASD02_12875 [Ensifer sp. Root1252]KQW84372.1 hypothetical protein ASD03_00980 [Ensifer sp. Root127]KQY61299.1 hypothetical protein ASD52_19030 [Ensifer sp. Root142]
MKKSIATLLVAAATLAGASTAFAGGSYYEGVSPKPLFTGRADASAGAGVSANTVDGGDYYAGIENKAVDAAATGAIANGNAKAFGKTGQDSQ